MTDEKCPSCSWDAIKIYKMCDSCRAKQNESLVKELAAFDEIIAVSPNTVRELQSMIDQLQQQIADKQQTIENLCVRVDAWHVRNQQLCDQLAAANVWKERFEKLKEVVKFQCENPERTPVEKNAHCFVWWKILELERE